MPFAYTSPVVQLIVPFAVCSTASDAGKVWLCTGAERTRVSMIEHQQSEPEHILLLIKVRDVRRSCELVEPPPAGAGGSPEERDLPLAPGVYDCVSGSAGRDCLLAPAWFNHARVSAFYPRRDFPRTLMSACRAMSGEPGDAKARDDDGNLLKNKVQNSFLACPHLSGLRDFPVCLHQRDFVLPGCKPFDAVGPVALNRHPEA